MGSSPIDSTMWYGERMNKPTKSSLQNSYMDEPIPLELDHIDGNSDNNSRSNLRMICPICHARTPTYRGRNMKKRGSARTKIFLRSAKRTLDKMTKQEIKKLMKISVP